MQSTELRRVGFVGLGNMGGPMCGHLVRAGFDVTAYDIEPRRCDGRPMPERGRRARRQTVLAASRR
jgi:3-hydroxyisobutyrate dehydrogenase-like beta-hydroxyacid dehydrogenase